MVAAICLITTSACGKVRTSSISEADTLPDDVRIAASWSQPNDPIFNRSGFLSLDGDTTHELKKLENAPRYTKASSDSDGNVDFIDFSNMYVMGKSGTRIIPRHDSYVPDSQFINPYPPRRQRIRLLVKLGRGSIKSRRVHIPPRIHQRRFDAHTALGV